MEVKVETNEGHTEHLTLEDKIPADVGRKARMKIEADAEGDGESEEYMIKDAISSKEKAKMFLVSNMLNESNTDLEINDLTLESYDKIAREYWPQLQGKKKESESDSKQKSDNT